MPTLFECSQLSTVGGLIAAGLGVSLLPLSTINLLGAEGIVAWRTMRSPRISRMIGVRNLKERSLAPAAAALLATLLEENTVCS